jgi:hypothetical protein
MSNQKLTKQSISMQWQGNKTHQLARRNGMVAMVGQQGPSTNNTEQ